MCLTQHNQLTLLKNLLHEQITYQTVSIEEYTQIKKVIQKLMTNNIINSELKQILPEIYHFGIKGELVSSIKEHINNHEPQLTHWIDIIERSKITTHYINDKKIQ